MSSSLSGWREQETTRQGAIQPRHVGCTRQPVSSVLFCSVRFGSILFCSLSFQTGVAHRVCAPRFPYWSLATNERDLHASAAQQCVLKHNTRQPKRRRESCKLGGCRFVTSLLHLQVLVDNCRLSLSGDWRLQEGEIRCSPLRTPIWVVYHRRRSRASWPGRAQRHHVYLWACCSDNATRENAPLMSCFCDQVFQALEFTSCPPPPTLLWEYHECRP